MTSDSTIIQNHMEEWKRTEVCDKCFEAKIIDGQLCDKCMGFGKVPPKTSPDTTQEAAA